MNNQKKSFCSVLRLCICLILVIAFYLDLPEQGVSLQNEYSLTEIRDDYIRIIAERGSERAKTSMEALQMAIFTYLMAQRKLSDVRVSGLDLDSREYKDAEGEFRYALDCLRMARNNWESRIRTLPTFSYKKEHITKQGARQGFHNYDLNSLFLTTRKGYNGDRGIDFQMDIYEDVDPIYNPPEPRKKLNKDMINNLNLGFQFNDLPAKLAKTINDRDNSKKQTRFGNRGRQIKGESRDIFGQMGYNINARHSNKDLFNFEKLMNNKRPADFSSKIDELLEEMTNVGLNLRAPSYEKSKGALGLDARDSGNTLKKNAQARSTKLNKPSQDEGHKRERSRGVLEMDPEIPTDVATQIEKKLGGPMNYIDVSVTDLNKDKKLNLMYLDYIQAILKCLHLYESNSTFEEIFHCSRKQIDLSFKLLQKLQELKINFTFQKNSIKEIMKKYNIKSIKQSKPVDRTKESEEFLELLVKNNIFNHKSDGSGPPDSKAPSKSKKKCKYIPAYLDIYMDRYGFTLDEYFSSPRLIKAINYLAYLESEFINSRGGDPTYYKNKCYTYKMITDFIPGEILNKRAQKQLFNKTKENTE